MRNSKSMFPTNWPGEASIVEIHSASHFADITVTHDIRKVQGCAYYLSHMRERTHSNRQSRKTRHHRAGESRRHARHLEREREIQRVTEEKTSS